MNKYYKSVFISSLFIVLLIGSFISASAKAQGTIYNYQTGNRGTRMWVPSGIATIRGILIYGNGAGGDSRNEVLTPWHQGFARLHDFAVIGTSMWGNLSGTEIDIWDDHLEALATASGYAELVNAPWAPIGFSNGGQMSYGFNSLRPEKTIAFIANKGCCYNNRVPSEAALKTPGILIAGELDSASRRNSIQGLFDENRPRGALWAWVEQQGLGHEGRADSLVIPFMDEAIRLRYPSDQFPGATSGVSLLDVDESDGWLADQTTWKSGLTHIAPYGEYDGDKSTAGWIISSDIAHVYRAISTYDRNVNINLVLPPPYNRFEEVIDIWALESAPGDATFRIDLSGVSEWTKVALFDGADLLFELLPDSSPQHELLVNLTLRRGVHAISALVTHAGGMTVSTSDAVVLTVVPEPNSSISLGFLLIASKWMRARRLHSRSSSHVHSLHLRTVTP